jgi:pimeloyl-ACP methyl ester carboxylesterase
LWRLRHNTALLEPQFRTATYDLRGRGESDKPSDPGFYSDGRRWADELNSVTGASGMERPVLVASSFEALILCHYLRTHGYRRLAGRILIGAATSFWSEHLAAEAIETLDKLKSIRRFVSFSYTVFSEEQAREAAIACAAMVLAAAYAGMRRLDQGVNEQVLNTIGVPTLILHGLRDRLVRIEMPKMLAWLIPRSEMKLYQGAGHMPMIGASLRASEDLARFRLRLGPS